ncbi:hypothetical protein UFOVP1382_59 [uncultured Caudovirales phage]|uniref:Uncharacterized protein n=1 Tax=uncultured Caudovirales phage TaxID=2100421 RepID=A0A6J5S0J2_9CAUD|nr:hypothetical protein UFOVP1382_59 [uncultured Caudovirales phage]
MSGFLDWLDESAEGVTPGPAADRGGLVMFFVPQHEFDALSRAGARLGLSPQQALSRAVADFLEKVKPPS